MPHSNAHDSINHSAPNQAPSFAECRGETVYTGTLYHGTATQHAGSPKILPMAYEDTFIVPLDDGEREATDTTLMAGLYLTDNPRRAARYGWHKRGQFGDYPHIMAIDVAGIKLYDFRSKDDPNVNGSISLDMAQKWRDYFLANQHLVRSFTRNNWGAANNLDWYSGFLTDFTENLAAGNPVQRGYDIHSMLAVMDDDPTRGIGCRPLWSGLFVRFMVEEYGTQGLIASQAGEDRSWDNGTTFVINVLDDSILATQRTVPLQQESDYPTSI